MSEVICGDAMPVLVSPPSNPAPWGAEGGWLTMSDGAAIWYSDTKGEGDPILLVHGWTCSSRFWIRNARVLAGHGRVITMDLRGHGNSSKVLHGHTIARYGRDVMEVIEQLNLRNLTLVAWSMGGSVCLEYWRRAGNEGRLKAFALVDANLWPFMNVEENSHRMKAGRETAMHAAFRATWENPAAFADGFLTNMYVEGNVPPEDRAIFLEELRRIPPWIITAIHSDWLVRNYEPVLPTMTVPSAVFAGVFGPGSLEMGRHFASRLPDAEYHAYTDAGHMLFYERAERFNAELVALIRKADRNS